MAFRLAILATLTGCSTAAPATDAPRVLPEAWLVVAVYDDGLQVMRQSFATRSEADRYLRLAGPEPGDNAPTLAVQKDSASLRVQIRPEPISQPHHLTVRENWLRRNSRWTDSLQRLGLRCKVFTWHDEMSNDPNRTRLGGQAPPVDCACGAQAAYVGTLEGRAVYRCSACKAGHVRRAEQAPVGGRIGKARQATDFPWDEKTEAAYEDRIDRALAGTSPGLFLTLQATKFGGYGNLEPPSCACGKPMRFLGRLGDAELFQCCDSKVVWP